MGRTAKIALTIAIVVIVLLLLLLYVMHLRLKGSANVIPSNDLNINISNEEKPSFVTNNSVSLESVFHQELYNDVAEPIQSETESKETEIDYSLIPYGLFEDYDIDNTKKGLSDELQRFDINAMTVKFDNIYFYPGLYVRDIIDNSYWYTLLEHDVIAPGESAFVCLENSFWTAKEVKLNRVKDNRNGDIILWVHNFDDVDHEIRDCVIYKYQISYISCWDEFLEHPPLEYRGLSFGSEKMIDDEDTIDLITTDGVSAVRYQYGSIDNCQVLLDTVSGKGLMAITVSYNIYYLSEKLDGKGGDVNG